MFATFAALIALTISPANTPAAEPFRGGRIELPLKQKRVVTGHLNTIVTAGWAEVVPGDLYHAHLLLDTDSRNIEAFASLDHLLHHTVVVLYHSDEMLIRWRLQDGHLPVAKRRPRSIVGFPNGNVVPAVRLLKDPAKAANYEWGGTIHPNDLASQTAAFDARRNIRVRTASGWCLVNLQVDIFDPDPAPGVNPERLTATLDCMDPRTNPY